MPQLGKKEEKNGDIRTQKRSSWHHKESVPNLRRYFVPSQEIRPYIPESLNASDPPAQCVPIEKVKQGSPDTSRKG